MIPERLQQQIAFFVEIDKLKRIFRQTDLMDSSRKENDAEHSWHFCLMALLLAEYANAPVDLLRVAKMALVHDLVEIDAGDVLHYDKQANRDEVQRRERAAADRIFNLLPPDQAAEVRGLWDEFEARETPEAKYAAAIDRLQPMMHNFHTRGGAWRQHGVTAPQVREMNAYIANGSETLWEYARWMVDEAVGRGFLNPGEEKNHD